MKKVNFDAKLEHDFVKNYKILQALFDKKQISKVRKTLPSFHAFPDAFQKRGDRQLLFCSVLLGCSGLTFLSIGAQHVDVGKLCRAKPLDNLEFLQWIKRFFDLHYGGNEYNALERRGGKGGAPPAPIGTKENDSSNKPAQKTAPAATKTAGASRPASAAPKKTSSKFVSRNLTFCSALLHQ